mgnify:CR=1 FL=1
MSFLNLLGESARFLMSTMVPHLQICPCQIQICQYKRVEIGQHSMAWLRAWPYVCVCISTSLCVCKTPYIYASQWHGYRRRHIHIYTCMYANIYKHNKCTRIYIIKCNAVHTHIHPHKYYKTYIGTYVHTMNDTLHICMHAPHPLTSFYNQVLSHQQTTTSQFY